MEDQLAADPETRQTQEISKGGKQCARNGSSGKHRNLQENLKVGKWQKGPDLLANTLATTNLHIFCQGWKQNPNKGGGLHINQLPDFGG